jgi:hypothetical protein
LRTPFPFLELARTTPSLPAARMVRSAATPSDHLPVHLVYRIAPYSEHLVVHGVHAFAVLFALKMAMCYELPGGVAHIFGYVSFAMCQSLTSASDQHADEARCIDSPRPCRVSICRLCVCRRRCGWS